MLFENYHIVDIDEYTGDFDDVFFNIEPDSNSDDEVKDDKDKEVADLGEEKNSSRIQVIPETKESTIKSQIIFESNKNTKLEENQNIQDEEYQDNENNNEEIKYEVQNLYKEKEDRNYKKKIYFSEEMAKFYRMKPNTFIGTSLGVIFALSTLAIGFWKTFLVFLIIAIANIIGQVLDNNSRILMLFDLLIGKFRNNRFR